MGVPVFLSSSFKPTPEFMSETKDPKADLLCWIRYRFALLVQEKYKWANLDACTYIFTSFARIDQSDQQRFCNAAFRVFNIREEGAKDLHQKLQAVIKSYRQYEKAPDEFYNSEQCRAELQSAREAKQRCRAAYPPRIRVVSDKTLLVSPREPLQVFKHMNPRFFTNYNTLYLPGCNGQQNDVLDRASHYGPIYGLLTAGDDVYLQFVHAASLLSFCFFAEDRLPGGAAVVFGRAERADEPRERPGVVLLTGLAPELVSNRVLDEPYLKRRYVDAVYLDPAGGRVAVVFCSVGCQHMFLKNREFAGSCEAALQAPDFALDAFQQLPFTK